MNCINSMVKRLPKQILFYPDAFTNRGRGILNIDDNNFTLTKFYIDGVEYSSKEYEQKLLITKQQLTVVLGRDIPNVVSNYLI